MLQRRLSLPGPALPVLLAIGLGGTGSGLAQEVARFRPAAACATTPTLEGLRAPTAGTAAQAALRERPALGDERVILSADDRFLIRYATAPGPEAEPLAEEVARILVLVRDILVGRGGWTEPAGGDQPLEVYLVPAGRPGPSRAVPADDPELLAEEGGPAFVVVRGPASTWTAQALHQYLHVLQLGYSVREAPWFYEASALLLEERLTGGGALEAGLLARRMARPEISLMSNQPGLAGGGALFLAYLTETRGAEVLKRAWERAGLIFGDNALGALNAALRLGDLSTLQEAWREFTVWNGLPDPAARPPDLYASLSAAVPVARPARLFTGLAGTDAAARPLHIEPMGAAYVQVKDLGEVGAVQVELEIEPEAPVSADVLVSWRHVPGGWLAVPLSFLEGRAQLGVPLEQGSQMVLVVRHDGQGGAATREVSFSLSADPGFPFELAFLSADSSPGQIDLSWGSESERRMYGWMVYRATDPQGPFQAQGRFPMPSMGESDEPLAYDFVDTDVVPGTLYYYQVEGITIDGLARRSPVVARRAEPAPAP